MVEIAVDSRSQTGHILLRPNQSANWQTVYIIAAIISFVIFIIALYMASIGAWLVLPFSGLEIAVLIMANYYVLCRNARQEVIVFSEDNVTIEKGIRHPSKAICFQRHWTKTRIIPPAHPHHLKTVALFSKNQQVVIGKFLNEEDREILSKTLHDMLRKPF